jgi:hypothetical protein
MSSKLSLHLQAHPNWADGNGSQARWIKVMDPPSENRWPGKQIIGRVYMPDNDSHRLVAQGVSGAETWFRFCQPTFARAPYIRIWEGPNEPQPVADLGFCRKLSEFTIRLAELMHGAGLQLVGGNLSEGNPGGDEAQRRACFVEIARGLAHCDYWSQHCYWVLDYPHPESGMNDWHAFRYRMNVRYANEAGIRLPPLLITECGVDGGVVAMPKRGWRTFCRDRAHYMQQLAMFDAELAKDPYVLTANIFTAGPMGWEDFDVTREMNDMINAHIQAQGGSYSYVPEPGGSPLGDLLRTQFGADYEDLSRSLPRHATLVYQERALAAIDRIVLHHTDAPRATTWQSVAQYHVNSNGWPGIGYHIGVRRHNGVTKISLLNDPRTRSYHAHTVGNDRGLAVCLAGSFTNEEPTVWEVDVLRQIVLVVRRWATWTATPLPIVGHQDVPGNQTSCPGNKLAVALPWLNSPDNSGPLIWSVAKSAQTISPNPASAIEVAMRGAGYTPIGNEADVRMGSTWMGVAQLGYRPTDGREVAFFATNLTPDRQWTVRQINKP